MMRRIFFSIIILLTLSVRLFAEEKIAAQDIKLIYKAYWGGFVISKIYVTVKLKPDSYKLDSTYKVVGLASIFSNLQDKASVWGKITKDRVLKPLHHENTAHWSDNSLHTVTDFREEDGKIIAHDYAFKLDREAEYISLADENQFGPDIISFYLSLMLNNIALSSKPQVKHQTVFDGFFLLDISYSCPDVHYLDSKRSQYKGEVIACEFSDKIMDGKFVATTKKKSTKKKKKKKEKAKPLTLWFAVPEGLDDHIPVYSEFPIGWGKVRIYLSDVEVIPLKNQISR